MKILNFGSLNLDLVYQIPHFVRAGETLSTTSFTRNVGGKGLNQSVALAKAGAEVYHAGLIGEDGGMLKDFLAGQAKAMGSVIADSQLLAFSRNMIEETQQKLLR